jgi:TetR/AcrR family transcriptional repressor of nem operon
MAVAESVQDDRLTSKGRATRARIVQVAAALMYERGVANASTEEIRAAAGVSNSQLYHYFTDKHDLIRAVVTHQIDCVLSGQESLLGGLDSFSALEAWRDAIIDVASRQQGRGGCPIGSLASELADLDEHARVALDAGFARWETAIRDGLVAMRERGELREDADPDQLAMATLATLQGGLLLTQTRRDIAPLRTGLDAAIGYIRTFRVASAA